MIEAGESTVHVISTEQHAEYQFEFWAMQHLDTAFSQILYDMISCKKTKVYKRSFHSVAFSMKAKASVLPCL